MSSAPKIIVRVIIIAAAAFVTYHLVSKNRGSATTVPSILQQMPLSQALADASKASPPKIVVADFSAGWCGPCQSMKREFWTRSDVRDWLAPLGTAVEVDIDAHSDLASTYKADAIPLLVVFKNGKEVARNVGYGGPEETFQFLKTAVGK